ncbi:MAG: hypothetical protein ACK56I_17485, partial [bacterium]
MLGHSQQALAHLLPREREAAPQLPEEKGEKSVLQLGGHLAGLDRRLELLQLEDARLAVCGIHGCLLNVEHHLQGGAFGVGGEQIVSGA